MLNREILFRGKRLDNNEWVEGSFCPKNSNGDISCIIVYDGKMAGYWFEVDPATVGQYTGLKDKNGKRILRGILSKQGMVSGISLLKMEVSAQENQILSCALA